jgi:primosomal protein N' (replication factor Y)
MVRLDALDERLTRLTAERVARAATARLPAGVEVLGPSPAPIERLRNRYRYRLMLRGQKRAPLYEVAHRIADLQIDRRVRLHIDVDPVSML